MDLKKYFMKAPLVPAVIQENGTKKVLMMAYMNEESLRKTIETGYTWFFSRSRNRLWKKGETSGHVQKVIRITGDCDDDTLLVEVEQTGPACHTGNETCFYQEPVFSAAGVTDSGNNASRPDAAGAALQELYQVVLDRRSHPVENSYTYYLFEKGLDKILKKCGEECSEVIVAAKNIATTGDDMKGAARWDLKNEICDLLYHLIVLMVNEGIGLNEIDEILKQRSRKIGNLKAFRETDRNS